MDWQHGTVKDFRAEYANGGARGPRAIRWLLKVIHQLENRLPDADIIHPFICPTCDYRTGWTMAQVPENGSPVCFDCGDDMILEDAAKTGADK